MSTSNAFEQVLDPVSDASRFLGQTTFGADLETINAVAGQSYSDWIDDQRTKPISLNRQYMEEIDAVLAVTGHLQGDQFPFLWIEGRQANPQNFTTQWLRNVIFEEDQLRQRVAWALSQILVVSYVDDGLSQAGMAIADYYDLLMTHAFGNYGDLLKAVTKHGAMAWYLSSLGNRKADPSLNRYPDENYAREIMQLFTIGLWELNPDGTRQLDSDGKPIPTYSNAEITELARVFTGLWFEGKPFLYEDEEQLITDLGSTPLASFPEEHDMGEKIVFEGKPWRTVFPAGADPSAEIDAAVDMLFNHPNTPPFISRQLIQFLVKSDPSAAYVGRIAAVFEDNGTGERGDLFTVVKAILLDDEARNFDPDNIRTGKLLEPMLRLTRLFKAFKAGVDNPNFVYHLNAEETEEFGQWPMYSPSVFNFFSPGYIDSLSELGTANPPIVSPGFQIIDVTTLASIMNYLATSLGHHEYLIFRGNQNQGTEFRFDFSDEFALMSDRDALLDRLDLLLCFGSMRPETRELLLNSMATFGPDANAQRQAIQHVMLAVTILPEATILR